MNAIWRDLRLALRMLRKSPGYTTVAVLTLGLAIGATTAIFSVVDAALLQPFPYKQPDRLVEIWESSASFPTMSDCYLDVVDWQKQATRTFTGIAGFRDDSYNLTSGGSAQAERLAARQMTANTLDVLGLAPELGRSFTADEDRLDGPPVVMLGDGFYTRHYARDPQILGKTLQLSGMTYTIVGVMPAKERFDEGKDIYVPLGRIPESMRSRGNHPGLSAIGRLAPGATLEQARAELLAINDNIAKTEPANQGMHPSLESMQVNEQKHYRSTLILLMVSVLFVLLIAIANLANLTLSRGMKRGREMAVRAALGASRARLIRQMLVESAVLGVLAGGLGAVISLWGVDLLASLPQAAFPTEVSIITNWRVLAFALAVAVGAGVIFGLWPALQASRTDLASALKDGERGMTNAGHGRARSVFVVAEMALALMLLVGAGLSIRAVLALRQVDLGFRSDDLLAAAVSIQPSKYPSHEAQLAFYRELHDRLAAVPGVEAATISAGLPLEGAAETGFGVEGRPKDKPGEGPMTVIFAGDVDLPAVLDTQLVAGRRFAKSDSDGGPPLAMVDEVLARHYFQTPAGALAKHVMPYGDKGPRLEIIGVVKHVVNYGLGRPEPASDQMYVLYGQVPLTMGGDAMLRSMDLMVRARGVPPDTLRAAIAAQVAALDPDQPIYDVETLEHAVSQSLAPQRYMMILLGVFAGLALLLAAIGLYSVMSYAVAQRSHEIGVRMALGASPGNVLRLVVGQGARLVGLGLLLGLAGSLALGRVIQSLVVGVAPTDPVTFVVVALVLVATALLASYLPARRAARVDPMVALRAE